MECNILWLKAPGRAQGTVFRLYSAKSLLGAQVSRHLLLNNVWSQNWEALLTVRNVTNKAITHYVKCWSHVNVSQYELWSPSRCCVAGIMLSRPSLLCISEIIQSWNSCSWGEMTSGWGRWRAKVEGWRGGIAARDRRRQPPHNTLYPRAVKSWGWEHFWLTILFTQ